jgi:2,4-dienoyl-CoA reductase (NADPH2)
VILHLGLEMQVEELVAMNPVLAIVATGTMARALEIELGEGSSLVAAFDILMGDIDLKVPPGGRVLVYGGGETGCEPAEYFAVRDANVVLVTRSSVKDLARSAEMVYRMGLTQRLRSNPRVEILERSTILAIRDGTAVITQPDGQRRLVAADRFVLAQGRDSQASLAAKLMAAGIPCHVIGDSRAVGRIGDAVHAAYQALRGLSAQSAATQTLAC